MYKLFIFHQNSSYATAPKYLVTLIFHTLFCILYWQIVMLIYINHDISKLNVKIIIFLTTYITIKPIQQQK
jgi:hypothetical protein